MPKVKTSQHNFVLQYTFKTHRQSMCLVLRPVQNNVVSGDSWTWGEDGTRHGLPNAKGCCASGPSRDLLHRLSNRIAMVVCQAVGSRAFIAQLGVCIRGRAGRRRINVGVNEIELKGLD